MYYNICLWYFYQRLMLLFGELVIYVMYCSSLIKDPFQNISNNCKDLTLQGQYTQSLSASQMPPYITLNYNTKTIN